MEERKHWEAHKLYRIMGYQGDFNNTVRKRSDDAPFYVSSLTAGHHWSWFE